MDTGWEREDLFSLKACHWVYQPHSRECPVTRSSWPTQSGLCILRAFVLLWGLFCLTVFLCFDFLLGGFRVLLKRKHMKFGT